MRTFSQIFAEVASLLSAASKRDRAETPSTDSQFQALDQMIDFLGQVVEKAIAEDDRQARSFWSRIKAFFSGNTRTLRLEGERLKALAIKLLEDAQRLYKERIAIHRGAVAQLRLDATSWQERQRRVGAMITEAAVMERIEGWDGPASQEYASAVRLQVNALDELGQVMNSAARSCLEGAANNEIRFTNVRVVIDMTCVNIQAANSRSGRYYERTAAAARGLELMISSVDDICFGADVQKFVQNLEFSNRTSMTQGFLLPAFGWPTGTQGSARRSHRG